MIAPKDVYKVMGALRRHFDYIVVDTPAQLSEIVLAAFDHSTRVLCMVTLDLPSIRNMRVFLSTLEKLRINSQTIGVVLNKVEDDIGIDINDVQEVLDNKIVSILPYSREVMKSINKGKPALVSAANSDIGKKLAGGMHQFLSDEAPTLETGSGPAAIERDTVGSGGGRRRVARTRRPSSRRPDRDESVREARCCRWPGVGAPQLAAAGGGGIASAVRIPGPRVASRGE